MSKDINITGDSEINEFPEGFNNDDEFNENDSLNVGIEFSLKIEQSTIFHSELNLKNNFTDCNINKEETIPSSVYEDLDKMFIGKKKKKKE